MKYKLLTEKQSKIWIKNINTIISTSEILIELSKEKTNNRNEEYRKYYYSTWYQKLFNSTSYNLVEMDGMTYICKSNISFISWIFNDTPFVVLDKIKPLTYSESLLYWGHDDIIKKTKKLKEVLYKWNNYALSTFEINDTDLEYYISIKKYFNNVIKPIAIQEHKLDETFNLDEDC